MKIIDLMGNYKQNVYKYCSKETIIYCVILLFEHKYYFTFILYIRRGPLLMILFHIIHPFWLIAKQITYELPKMN